MKVWFALQQYGFFIGRGPSTLGPLGRASVFVLAIVSIVAALDPGTRVRGAFSYGNGPSVPINTVGRVIFCLVSLVLVLLALGVFH
jgi:hypothetical protein